MNHDYEEQIQELREEVKALKAQLKEKALLNQYQASSIMNYHIASINLLKLGRAHLLGSGLILSIHHLNGKEAIEPVCIKDGMSSKSINSLLDDIQYSFDLAVSFTPTKDRLKEDK